jgi:phosphoribosylformylglycinamidine synthase subunit PurQ / glutaminase
MIRTIVVTGHGINAHEEMKRAFDGVGAATSLVHVDSLTAAPGRLRGVDIVAFPGGFSYGDHLGAGVVLSGEVSRRLTDALTTHVERGGLILGVCNGFQVLLKSGLLGRGADGEPAASLVHNASGTFENSWVEVAVGDRPSPWLSGPICLDLPIRHGEGRFVTRTIGDGELFRREGRIALRYVGRNPNGSWDDVAGLLDATGRVLGMMPHPEAYVEPFFHPRWARGFRPNETGMFFFRNAVAALSV